MSQIVIVIAAIFSYLLIKIKKLQQNMQMFDEYTILSWNQGIYYICISWLKQTFVTVRNVIAER